MEKKFIRILGIDPGSLCAGFACVTVISSGAINLRDFRVEHAGVVKFSRLETHSTRLMQLHLAFLDLIEELKPDLCALEKAFFGINALSALKIGEARGALIAAIGVKKVKMVELAPREAKKSVTGKGHATKEEVAQLLKISLKFERGNLPYDVTDSLALAIAAGLDPGFELASYGNGQNKSQGF